jgi:TRAP-type C4-dicarboxylate transport system substrate-binding protein
MKLLRLIGLALGVWCSATVSAAEVTLRLHHFLSDKAPLHQKFLEEWVVALENASNGRIDIEIFHGMSLGGTPGDLYDQAVSGEADIVLTVPGYTPGRFKRSEVFELPFLMEDSVATSKAFWDLIAGELQQAEYADARILAGWVHGPGVVHTRQPITRLEDITGMPIRGPTRLATELLRELGATPVAMPLPSIPDNLRAGKINGTLLPWEVTPSIKLADIVSHHLEFDEKRAMYTTTFVMAMNRDAYRKLPEELQRTMDNFSGKGLSAFAAEVMAGADAFGRLVAGDNNVTVLKGSEVQRWIVQAQPLYNRWFAYTRQHGFDGSAMLGKARELIQYNRWRP